MPIAISAGLFARLYRVGSVSKLGDLETESFSQRNIPGKHWGGFLNPMRRKQAGSPVVSGRPDQASGGPGALEELGTGIVQCSRLAVVARSRRKRFNPRLPHGETSHGCERASPRRP